ncbi:hypothetical protein MBLNU230_g7984t1 [Neophaeotheca triangularis]
MADEHPWRSDPPDNMDISSPAPSTDEPPLPPSALARMSSAQPQSRSSNLRMERFHQSRSGKNAATSTASPRPLNHPSRVTSVPMPMTIPSNPSVIPGNNLPSAPASPPTPAPSPTPMHSGPDWSTADPREDLGDLDLEETLSHSHDDGSRGYGLGYRHVRAAFANMDNGERQRMLSELLNMCDAKVLGFVANFVGPRLKRDPFSVLPNELCLRILTFIDDPRTLARSGQVSKRWHELVSDDMAWKSLCEKHSFRQLSEDERPSSISSRRSLSQRRRLSLFNQPSKSAHSPREWHSEMSGYEWQSPSARDLDTRDRQRDPLLRWPLQAPEPMTYQKHFKQRFQVDTAWRSGGSVQQRQITPDQGVVTSLHLTPEYIIVALDNAKIHVFDTEGRHLRCLQGHVMGVWAMVPHGETLVSGGCDRDVRVWDLSTGQPVHMLRGHTSTVRCLKMSGSNIAISGSRDTTLRIWDIKRGVCKHVLVGHQASVRCLEIAGDYVVSGSYDTTARIWSIADGRCIRTLQGHFSQIYAIAFDGNRVATGSLDTSVRVWDPRTGACLAQLQGHTSLVGQLQLRNNTLVTGGSDGSVRVWSLETYSAVHRLAAHDNSVTSLQFDDNRIVSGGSDGRVKVWDLKTGCLVRELGNPAEAVWRVVFEEEKAVVLASRTGKTVMEVWSFAPPAEEDNHAYGLPNFRSAPDFNRVEGFGETLYRGEKDGEVEDVGSEQRRGGKAGSSTSATGSRRRLLMEEQDAVMSDIYSDQGGRSAQEASRFSIEDDLEHTGPTAGISHDDERSMSTE